jgi:hypothetical protein
MSAPSDRSTLPQGSNPSQASTRPPTNLNNSPSIGPELGTLWAVSIDPDTNERITTGPWSLTANTHILAFKTDSLKVLSLTLDEQGRPVLESKGIFTPSTTFHFGRPAQGYMNYSKPSPGGDRWAYGVAPLEQEPSPDPTPPPSATGN